MCQNMVAGLRGLVEQVPGAVRDEEVRVAVEVQVHEEGRAVHAHVDVREGVLVAELLGPPVTAWCL